MTQTDKGHEYEFSGLIANGFVILFAVLFFLAAGIVGIVLFAQTENVAGIVASSLLLLATLIVSIGFYIIQPNQSRVMIFFGQYRGTVTRTGFFWSNPFMESKKVSLRINNLDIEPIKVNDKTGNPVMIGMVLVWRIKDTFRAIFDVERGPVTPGTAFDPVKGLSKFVRIQSDAALREVTGHYAYDLTDGNSGEITLRSGGEEINERLENKINERVAMAGIEVIEARINYLAYAPEIAAVMLRRQQASAIISAREKIVEGAVSMVKMALNQLSEEQIVELDEERKAAMVSNLLVVLCADEPAQPVLNTGTLYN